jgi:hypothetical protein
MISKGETHYQRTLAAKRAEKAQAGA